VTVTGMFVDATHGKRRDGVRHEGDGDAHAWLKLDWCHLICSAVAASLEWAAIYP
jgi:hypothetical protein